jgi:hypothetical protein
MNDLKLDLFGILELQESAHCRAAALISSVRREIESTGCSIYASDMSHNLDTAHRLISEAGDFRVQLERLIKQGGAK